MNINFDLPDDRVAIAGDWHGSVPWALRVIPAFADSASDVRTILHLGDFWPHRGLLLTIDELCAQRSIERVLVTLGNHEPYNLLSPLLRRSPSGAVRISKTVHVLQRPQRISIGGRQFLSLGGAASVDRAWREEGFDWWQDEEILDEHVQAAIAGGPCDVMLTHESVNATPVPAVQRILRPSVGSYPEKALAASRLSRQQVDLVWDATQPAVLLHGHMHAPDAGIAPDGRHVVSLGCDDQRMNAVILDLVTLAYTIIDVPGVN